MAGVHKIHMWNTRKLYTVVSNPQCSSPRKMKRSEKLESETEREMGVLGQEKKRDKREKEVNKRVKDKNEAKIRRAGLGAI